MRRHSGSGVPEPFASEWGNFSKSLTIAGVWGSALQVRTMSSSDQPPTADLVVRRRWRVFLTMEFALLCGWVLGAWATLSSPVFPQVQAVFLSVVGAWLCFSLPVAVLYLLGRAPVMSLSPLWPSPQQRAYRREVGARPVLTDEEFYTRFYEGSGIPPDIPAKVRHSLADLDLLIERAYPTDVIAYADDELDFADVIFRVGRQFGVRFTKEDYPRFTGTLGNLIDQVHERLRRESASS
jgi:hypothetical protein